VLLLTEHFRNQSGGLVEIAADASRRHVLEDIPPTLGQRVDVVDGHGVFAERVVAQVALPPVGLKECGFPADGKAATGILVLPLAARSLAVLPGTPRAGSALKRGATVGAMTRHNVTIPVTVLHVTEVDDA